MHASFVANEMTQLEIDTIASKPTPQELEGEPGSKLDKDLPVPGRSRAPPKAYKFDKVPRLSVVPGSVANLDNEPIVKTRGIGPIFDELAANYGDLKSACDEAGIICTGNAAEGALQHNGPIAWARYYCAGEDHKLDSSEKENLIKILKSFAGPLSKLIRTNAGHIQPCMNGFAGEDDIMSEKELADFMKTLDLYDGSDDVLQDVERVSLVEIINIGFRPNDAQSKFLQPCMIKFEYHLFMSMVEVGVFYSGGDQQLKKGGSDSAKTMRTIVNTVIETHLLQGACNDKTGEDLSSGPECQKNVENFGKLAVQYSGDGKKLAKDEVEGWCKGEFPLGEC